jgi:hypothetical protein
MIVIQERNLLNLSTLYKAEVHVETTRDPMNQRERTRYIRCIQDGGSHTGRAIIQFLTVRSIISYPIVMKLTAQIHLTVIVRVVNYCPLDVKVMWELLVSHCYFSHVSQP